MRIYIKESVLKNKKELLCCIEYVHLLRVSAKRKKIIFRELSKKKNTTTEVKKTKMMNIFRNL